MVAKRGLRDMPGRRSPSTTWYKWACVFALITLVNVVTHLDQALSDESAALLASLERQKESPAFLFLNGFNASKQDSPARLGLVLLQAYQGGSQDGMSAETGHSPIELPAGELFCRLREEGCVAALFQSGRIDVLLQRHETLLSRLYKFYEFDEFATLTEPSFDEQVPPYSFLSAAARLRLLEAIRIYHNGAPGDAVEDLMANLAGARAAMARQDNLLGKMVLLMVISDILDVASVMVTSAGLAVEEIPEFSDSEKDFRLVAAREFSSMWNLLREEDKDPGVFAPFLDFPGWTLRKVFKPTMTLNAAAPVYYRLERMARMSPGQFTAEIEKGTWLAPGSSRLLNATGDNILSAVRDYDEYAARLLDINVKIAVFNHLHHSGKYATSFINPYYPDDRADANAKRICVSGPLEDSRGFRCLRVAL